MDTFHAALAALTDDKWNSMSIQEKLSTLQAVENEIAVREGRTFCQVSGKYIVSDRDSIILGSYSREMRDITINTEQLAEQSEYGRDYRTHLDTILHEGRHSYQHQAVLGEITHSDPEMVKAWADNMAPGHYIRYEHNPKAYFDQPIERDAAQFAQETAAALEQEKAALLEQLGADQELALVDQKESVEAVGRAQIEEQTNLNRDTNLLSEIQREEVESQLQPFSQEISHRDGDARQEIETQMEEEDTASQGQEQDLGESQEQDMGDSQGEGQDSGMSQ